MIIWIFTLLLVPCVAYAGYTLGVIRAAFSFVGLVIGTLLAGALGHFMNPVVALFGVKNPVLVWAFGPAIVLLVILIAFKIAGVAVHQKVDVYYKYHAGDLRMGLWNRLNARLGLCVGAFNAVIYIILIGLPFHMLSYATFQLADDDRASWTLKTVNLVGRGIESSGMGKIEAALNPLPESYYDAVDLVALIYHNDLLEGRLSRYPGFLALGEKPEFQDIASDKEFTEMRQKQVAFQDILDHPKAQNILNNPDLLRQIWATVSPDLKDLQIFLKTSQSPKYDGEKILGRWTFDLNGALNLIRKNNPNISSFELGKLKQVYLRAYKSTTLVATTEKTVIIKNVGVIKPSPKPGVPGPVEFQTLQGMWETDGGKYKITGAAKVTLDATVEGDKLSLLGDTYPMRFDRDF